MPSVNRLQGTLTRQRGEHKSLDRPDRETIAYTRSTHIRATLSLRNNYYNGSTACGAYIHVVYPLHLFKSERTS